MPSILFVAGDLSGDIHSGLLCDEVRRRHPDWKLYALGGPRLREAEAQMIGDTSGCGVIGLASALALLPRVLRLKRRLLQFLQRQRIDAAVLCDWGAFNGRLLPQLQAVGVPILYYFPPRSWQREGMGGLGIVPFVSRVATPFEWSATRLQNAGCRAEWVGHPLLEIVEAERQAHDRDDLWREFGVGAGERLIALLPGSRDMELRHIGPRLKLAVSLLRQRDARLRFVAAVPRGASERARRFLGPNIPLCEGRATQALLSCDAALVKSGTATLEAAVAGAPQAVVYDGPKLMRAQWQLSGMSRRVPFIAMPNILMGRGIVRELLGDAATPEALADEVLSLLHDDARRETLRADYESVRVALGARLGQGATKRTAEMLDEMLEEKRQGG